MSTRLIMRRIGDRLAPVDDIQREELQKIANGQDLIVETKRARNPKQHRLYFALLKITLDNCDDFKTTEMLLTWLKVKLEYVDTMIMPTGETVFVPKSIAFANMDQTLFAEFFDRSIDVIVHRYGFDRPALLAEIESATGLHWSEAA